MLPVRHLRSHDDPLASNEGRLAVWLYTCAGRWVRLNTGAVQSRAAGFQSC